MHRSLRRHAVKTYLPIRYVNISGMKVAGLYPIRIAFHPGLQTWLQSDSVFHHKRTRYQTCIMRKRFPICLRCTINIQMVSIHGRHNGYIGR